MPAGQPKKYNDQMLDRTYEYSVKWDHYGDVIPSIDRLALVLGVCRKTLLNWRDRPECEEFSQLLEDIKTTQKLTLLNRGLDNTFNSNIAKLALGNHGFHDRSESEVKNINLTHDEWIDSLE